MGMVAERVVRCFWPLWSVGFVILAPLMFGFHETLSLELFWGLSVLAVLAVLIAAVWGVRRFAMPDIAQATDRVDAALAGRPIAAMADAQAIGRGDPASEAVWRAHIAQMQDAVRGAQPVKPDLRVADRDPYGLRFIALLFFVCALMFGSLWRVGTVGDVATGGDVLATGPVWEGWIEPPRYTGKPAIYLNDVPAGILAVPVGSKVSLRLYGEVGALTVAETVSGRTEDLGAASQAQQVFAATTSGRLAIEGENGAAWDIRIIADTPPQVDLMGPVEADAMGEMSQPFEAVDDYGVESGVAVIALDLGAVDRRYCLAVAPDGMDDLVLDLPMPFNGDRSAFDAFLVDNLSQHPLANLPVTMTLTVTDAAEQAGQSMPEQMTLPGRRFFQPFAKAIVEQRRDLMWSRANAPQIARVMRALSHRPEGLFSNETTYLRLRAIIRRIEGFGATGITPSAQDELVQAMWDLAIQLEDGTLADARERLRRAQERLSEAMRDGASDAEIAELMEELRAATDDYMRLLAQEMEPDDGTDQADSGGESQTVTDDEIQALMDRIQELMEEGRMAEAEELMAQLNALLENLRMAQGGAGEGSQRTPGQQAMDDLSETLQDQETLSDEAFQELQDRANAQDQQGQSGEQGQGDQGQSEQGQGQQGQSRDQSGQDGQTGEGMGVGEQGSSGQQGENGQGGEGGSLAERQQALRDELNRQRGNLPNLEGEAGEIARQSLERADNAMDGAEDALREGDLAQAIDRQAEAMEALRNGMRSLNQALAENSGAEPGQGSERGEAQGRPEPTQRDPLGRELGNTGQFGTDEGLLQDGDIYRRAEELLGEIRRRSAEQERPEVERDYLRRLLDQF